MIEFFVGRQPIYNRQLEVFAYELLYRNSEINRAQAVNGDHATSRVILDAFTEIGIENIVGDRLAFINFTRPFLMGKHPLPFSPEKVVLEVMEDITVDEPLVNAVRALSESGYRIALDDFIFHESLRPLVDTADIVKIDVLALDRPTIREHFVELRRSNVKLLAEKIETQEQFEFCLYQGFDYFQGYFFCEPKIIKGFRMPANRLAALRLMAKLQNPAVEVRDLDAIISHDVSLSYRLLRYINSAFFALPRKIESIRQAIVYLGMQAIKTWASLISLSDIEDKPNELLTIAITRGKMCELLGERANQENLDSFFTVGLFSTLESLLDARMEEIIESLPLADEIAQALLDHQGILGEALSCTLAYERGEWDAVTFRGIAPGLIADAYLRAIAWADQARRELVI